MNRREFLIGSVAAAAAFRSGRVHAQGADRARLDRVAIMTYSFDRIIKVVGRPDDPARTLDFFDVPEMFADK
jgi:hypothetical protein